jgi:hypothetical protein
VQNDDGWHVPAEQRAEQHWDDCVHGFPSVRHVALSAPHVPPVHTWLQHALDVAQAALSAAHAGTLQTPLEQSPEQQSAPALHALPRFRQPPPASHQVPPLLPPEPPLLLGPPLLAPLPPSPCPDPLDPPPASPPLPEPSREEPPLEEPLPSPKVPSATPLSWP